MHLKTLLWKDFRHQTGFLVGAIVVLLIPYVIALGAYIANYFSDQRVAEGLRFYEGASIADVMLASLLVAFFAGNAIAGERSDGSAEFFSYLPISKRASALSKLIVSLGLVVIILTFCIAVPFMFWTSGSASADRPNASEARVFLATCAAMFGVAWCASSFVRSATYAAATGLCVPIALGVTLALISDAGFPSAGELYWVLASVLGVAGVIAGTTYYIQRVEP